MNKFQSKLLSMVMAVMFLTSMLFVGREAAAYVAGRNVNAAEGKICVVIDAGHGSGNLRKVTKGKKIQTERQPLSLIS